MFDEVRVGVGGDFLVRDLRPRADWKDYMQAVLAKPRWGTERKTGVKHAEVITSRLVQDDRGWLRLAG